MKTVTVVLLVLSLFFTGFAKMPKPDKTMTWQEELTDIEKDPSKPSAGVIGPKRDKKIFANMLFFYGQLRQTAEGALKMLGSVSDFALRSFEVLVRMENIASTAIKIRDSVKDIPDVFRESKNPFQLIDRLSSHAYNNIIVGGTDMMWIQTAGFMDDLAAVNDARQNIVVSAVNIGRTWDLRQDTTYTVNETGDTVFYSVYYTQDGNKITQEEYQARRLELRRAAETDFDNKGTGLSMAGFSQTMRYQSRMAMQAINMTDPRLIAKYEFNPRAKRQGLTAEVTSSAIANANVRREQNENNFWELFYAINMASDGVGDETSITASTKAEVLGAENALFSTYGEHEGLNDFIKVMSAMALTRAGRLTTDVYSAAEVVQNTNRLSSLARGRAEEWKRDSVNFQYSKPRALVNLRWE